jgi:hypothetical protein
MTAIAPIHPVDALTPQEKCKIYYGRVVNLAVWSKLLAPDPNTEIGHFAFSGYFTEGIALDEALQEAIRIFSERYPELIIQRTAEHDVRFVGAVTAFQGSDDGEKIQDLIVVGASRNVWPVGTSHMLTYPWDLDGTGRPVRFRPDLTDFMKRRGVSMLKKAGKLHDPDAIFPTGP